jgi:ribosomal protein S18 acetylase RimI-like enzyme
LSPAIYRLTSGGGARYSTFWDWIEAHLPSEPCWVLDLVGVRPDAQGQGIGRALIAHGTERAHAAGQPVFLETGNQSNVAFYESLGFRVVHRERAPDDGPMIWFMQT